MSDEYLFGPPVQITTCADKFLGFPVHVDPQMAPGTLEIRDSSGRLVGRIIGLQANPNCDAGK